MPVDTAKVPMLVPEAVEAIDVRALRQGFELSQADFAHLGALAPRTLQL